MGNACASVTALVVPSLELPAEVGGRRRGDSDAVTGRAETHFMCGDPAEPASINHMYQ